MRYYLPKAGVIVAKYKNYEGNYLQMWKRGIEILNEHNKKIPYSTRWLYTHLHWLEHKFSGKKEDFFFRSIKDLQNDTKIGRRQIIKGIKILEDINLIQTWKMHWWLDDTHTKKSFKHITAFRLLEP